MFNHPRSWYLIAVFLMLAVLCCQPDPVPTSTDYSAVNIQDDPWIEMDESPEIQTRTVDGVDLEIEFKASYVVGGIALTIKKYHGGWRGQLAPYDLAIAWGRLVKDNTYKRLKWSQSGRWYYWHYNNDFPFDNVFVARHSSNNHVIPATENLKRALAVIRRGDEVELTGYLVDIDGKKGTNTYWWYSSVSVSDMGDGSCEVLYLTKLKIRENVYE